jgi:hypothetical protein
MKHEISEIGAFGTVNNMKKEKGYKIIPPLS